MSEITRVGVDLAKNVIQVHTVDAQEKLVTSGPVLAAHLSASTTRPSVDVQSVSLFHSHRRTRH
jgi:hypothetical protein